MNVLPGKYLHGKAGVLLWKNDLDIFLKKFFSPFHMIRDTDPCTECVWAWVLTETQGYRTYMHSACQFGSLGPQSPGPPNIVSPIYCTQNFLVCSIVHFSRATRDTCTIYVLCMYAYNVCQFGSRSLGPRVH